MWLSCDQERVRFAEELQRVLCPQCPIPRVLSLENGQHKRHASQDKNRTFMHALESCYHFLWAFDVILSHFQFLIVSFDQTKNKCFFKGRTDLKFLHFHSGNSMSELTFCLRFINDLLFHTSFTRIWVENMNLSCCVPCCIIDSIAAEAISNVTLSWLRRQCMLWWSKVWNLLWWEWD